MTKQEKAKEIIKGLDDIARDYDAYEFGLPVFSREKEMIDFILNII